METTSIDRNRKSEIRVSGPDSRPYVLGETEAEFRRLEMQSAFIRDLTEDVLKRAGLRPGMRVLDIGCGVGDVALLGSRSFGRVCQDGRATGRADQATRQDTVCGRRPRQFRSRRDFRRGRREARPDVSARSGRHLAAARRSFAARWHPGFSGIVDAFDPKRSRYAAVPPV